MYYVALVLSAVPIYKVYVAFVQMCTVQSIHGPCAQYSPYVTLVHTAHYYVHM